jgi:nucleotide-binding universal stress UspA family protein
MKNYKIKSILMPTDFSELSEKALKTAIAICNRQKAKLTLLHVVDLYMLFSSDEVLTPYYFSANEIAMKKNKADLKKLASKLSEKYNLEIQSKVVDGNPADMICKIAEKEKHDLIVMGTHGASGFRELFMGSNAFRVVKYSPCPVLTVPGNWDKDKFDKIVFPIRLVSGAIDKYDQARPIIQKNNSSLLIIGLLENEKPESLAEFKNQADLLKGKLKKDNIEYSTLVFQSKNFPKKLLNASEGFDADLIVITASLDFDWKKIFIGHYAQHIVNHSKRPVLSIKSEFETKELLNISEKEMKIASDKFMKLIVSD